WTVTLPAAWPTCCAPTPAGTWGSSGSSPVPAEVPRQGVPYPDPVVALPVVEVLRVERCAAERAGTAKNLRVPERDAVVAMELNRLKDVLRARTVDPPSRQVADDGGHGVHVQRPGDLTGHIDDELLEYLDAETPRTRAPQVRDQRTRPVVLGARAGVVGVQEDVRVDKQQLTVHAARPGSS